MRSCRINCSPSGPCLGASQLRGHPVAAWTSRVSRPTAQHGARAERLDRLGCLLIVVLWPLALPAAPTSPSATEKIYQRCQAACVEVLVNGRHSGSGWFARADGLVVTAAHLFERRDADVEVVSPGRGRLACSLLAVDRGHDIAVLKTKAPAGDFPVLGFSSAPLRVGDEILQFGAPLFRAGVLQPGRVAQPDTSFEFYPDRKGYVEVASRSGHDASRHLWGSLAGPRRQRGRPPIRVDVPGRKTRWDRLCGSGRPQFAGC